MRRHNDALARDGLRIRGDRLDRVRVDDQRQRDTPDDLPHRLEGAVGVPQARSDGDRVGLRREFEDLARVLAEQTMTDERMDDERRRVARDDGRGHRGRGDVDEVRAGPERAVPDEGGRAGVRSAGDDEDAAVLPLVARRLWDRIEDKLARSDRR